ncbi:alpha/beta hydrolase [Metabacillus mangrovi]|uniref:alpha/beta hydrolase n=1 Tax=Metabacillus mangrovi TaxID=1491830 RepID=UPI0030C865B2
MKKVIPGAQSFSIHKSSEQAVLLCHGFNGTPQSMEALGEQFASLGYSVYAPRLAGHGTCPEDMECSTAEEWYQTLESAYLKLRARFQKVYVIGQSMGGSLTIKLASAYPDIDGIGLINAALEVPDYENIHGSDGYLEEGAPDIKNPNVKEIAYNRVPLHAIAELKKAMKEACVKLKTVSCPAVIFCSPEDHVVPAACSEKIYHMIASSIKEYILLPNSYHVASMDYDLNRIAEEANHFYARKTAHPAKRMSM